MVRPVQPTQGTLQDRKSLRRRVRGWLSGEGREGYIKRAREKEREKTKKRPGCLSRLSFSFVSLESFPLPPLEETAAPATHTHTIINTLFPYSYLIVAARHNVSIVGHTEAFFSLCQFSEPFILYINDICEISKLLQFVLFADHTNCSSSEDNLKLLAKCFGYEIVKLKRWFDDILKFE